MTYLCRNGGLVVVFCHSHGEAAAFSSVVLTHTVIKPAIPPIAKVLAVPSFSPGAT